MTDYSQQGEQEHILANTPAVGRFLDIGAYHATIFSNTRALYERGWSGVMVEPSPGPFDSLLREYGNEERITLVCAAVGNGDLASLYTTHDALSTTVKSWYEGLQAQPGYQGGFYGSFLTPTVKISDLLYLGPFDFVIIDTEGSSTEIFRDVLIQMAPRCICVEQKQSDVWALHCGYKVAYQNGINVVYVKH